MRTSATNTIDSAITLEQLVHAIGAGDKAMECEFYLKYYPKTVRYLTGYTSDVARAEDIAHDTLLKVLLRLRRCTLDQPASLCGFVRQTAKYSLLEWRRLKVNQDELTPSFEDSRALTIEHDRRLVRDEQLGIIKTLIFQLPVSRDREVLLRTFYYDENKAVICESLGLDAKHLARVLSRAKKRLRESLAESGNVYSDFSDAVSN